MAKSTLAFRTGEFCLFIFSICGEQATIISRFDKPSIAGIQSSIHILLDQLQSHQNTHAVHICKRIRCYLKSQRTRMPVPIHCSKTVSPLFILLQLSIPRRVMIPISHLLPSKSIDPLLLLLVIIMPSEIQSGLNAKCIVPICGIRVIQHGIFLTVSLACIGLTPGHQVMHHGPFGHLLSPPYQTLSGLLGTSMFEIGPTVMNDVNVGTDVMCDAKYLIFVRVSTSSSLTGILHNEVHSGRLKDGGESPLKLTLV
mmetsp:Transcript_22565/g.45111  ORF Transcript_22565/g.45111 Transcript_22565/m.45111 type:complete len:255 (-) Transcript_22565:1370-2134(-)